MIDIEAFSGAPAAPATGFSLPAGAPYTSSIQTATWRFGAYRPDCAGCHAGDIKNGSHTKYKMPQKTLYAVDELRDCSGACQVYADSSLKKIVKSRSGEHRPSDSKWD